MEMWSGPWCRWLLMTILSQKD